MTPRERELTNRIHELLQENAESKRKIEELSKEFNKVVDEILHRGVRK